MILYVANRGEIARRILRTAKRLGFKTAVGYAEQDRDLPFAREADQAISLEGEEARETYLHFEKVLAAALSAKATHLHPGYGFLSENPEFVERVAASGIKFVGPSAKSMRLLGDKIGSRQFLKTLNVPLLPSYDGNDQRSASLLAEAKKLGFPLLIKPSAGGGGKGMLRVDRAEDFMAALESSKRTAKAAFGDDRVFLERLIEKARHIEVQIFGDESGHIHSFGERECSLQKRHQKVIEEAPCVFLSAKVREKICEDSRRIAREAKYHSLGTVEWIWDGADGIYFLEVNARLQVEHPVTELVWNLDLVELQLKAALGEKFENFNLAPLGHSIEARVCAEDPDRDFLPSGGKIHRLRLPADVRVDFGFREKNTIPPQFDSLMGKIISYGENREEARVKLIRALEELSIFGPATNRGFLIQLLETENFKSGDISTGLIAKSGYRFDWKRAFALVKELKKPKSAEDLTDELMGDLDWYSPWGFAPVESAADVDFEDFQEKRYFHSAFADWSTDRPDQMKNQGASETAASIEIEMRSPMPARVVKVFAKKGDDVKQGTVLLVLEAMKMEHQIKAARDVSIEEVFLKEGDRVAVDGLLVRFKA